MIIFIPVILKELFEFGRKYPWKRPKSCPKCGNVRVWVHAYSPALFDGFSKPLLLKLYRCPCCGCIIRLRPDSHFSRFQASINEIRSTLSIRIKTGRWPKGRSGPRPRHWLRSLKRKILALLDNSWEEGLIRGFDHLAIQGHTPVSRSI